MTKHSKALNEIGQTRKGQLEIGLALKRETKPKLTNWKLKESSRLHA